MAKSIVLQPKKAPKAEPMAVPPPASLPRGVTSGSPPLPVGRAVAAPNPATMTAEERKTLKNMGWHEGQPLPTNAAKIIDEVTKAAREDHEAGAQIPPVDPSTPALKFDPVNVNELSAEQQQAFQEKLQQAVAEQSAQAAPTQVMPKVAQTVMSGRQIEVEPEAPERPAPQGDGRPDPNYRPQAQSAPAAATPSATGAAMPLTNCPHCNWLLSLPDIPEPVQEEKLGFLQSFLGHKSFVKEYTQFGGVLVLTFRTLTVKEIDAIFQQAYREQNTGKLDSDIAFFERVNRLRLYLQLLRVRSGQRDDEQPDGLSKDTNPNATAFWETASESDTPILELIEDHMLSNVLTSESMMRVAMQYCGRFNRLVARLEALVDNDSFWKATGSQP